MLINLNKNQVVNLSLSNIREYLIKTGWTCDGELSNKGTIWHFNQIKYPDAEIILPSHNRIKDYADRIVILIKELSAVEDESPDFLIKRIENYSSDLVEIRVIHADVTEGSIPLDDGVMLYQNIREMLASAALSTITKQKNFSGRKPEDAQEYLRVVRFGQTEVGSYIVNVISPLNQKNIIQDEIVTSSFSRLVTQTLAKSLNALNSIESQINDLNEDQILNNSNHNDIFERIVDKGVSSNLCDALIGLTGVDKNRGFEITLMASEIIPHENDINVSIHFSSNIVSLLEKASNYYKENYVITGVTLTGQIKKLEREANKENGSVTIQTTVSGNKKMFLLNLILKNMFMQFMRMKIRKKFHAVEIFTLHQEAQSY